MCLKKDGEEHILKSKQGLGYGSVGELAESAQAPSFNSNINGSRGQGEKWVYLFLTGL